MSSPHKVAEGASVKPRVPAYRHVPLSGFKKKFGQFEQWTRGVLLHFL